MGIIPALPAAITTTNKIQAYDHDEEKMGDAQVSVVQVQVFGKGVRQCVLSRVLFDLRSFVVPVDNDG